MNNGKMENVKCKKGIMENEKQRYGNYGKWKIRKMKNGN